jgi:hypothetical protein
MISVLSIPRRYVEVIPRSACPSWRCMTPKERLRETSRRHARDGADVEQTAVGRRFGRQSGGAGRGGRRSIPTSRRLPPLPRRTKIAPRAVSRSLLDNASASLIRSPARQSTTTSPRNLSLSAVSPAARITAMISRPSVDRADIAIPCYAASVPSDIPATTRRRPAQSKWSGLHGVLLWTMDFGSSSSAKAGASAGQICAKAKRLLFDQSGSV